MVRIAAKIALLLLCSHQCGLASGMIAMPSRTRTKGATAAYGIWTTVEQQPRSEVDNQAMVTFAEFYAVHMHALHTRSPGHYEGEEAEQLVTLARGLEEQLGARSTIQATYNSARRGRGVTMDEVAPEHFRSYLQGPQTGGVAMPPIGRPRAVAGTVPLAQLDPRIEAYDPASLGATGVPRWLARGARLDDMFYSFTDGGQPDSGSAAHLGMGFVVSARHVIDQFIPYDLVPQLNALEGFSGTHSFPAGVQGWNNEAGWSLLAFPPKGKFDNSRRRVSMGPNDYGEFNDCALLRSPHRAGGVAGIRATSSLAAGERLFIVGDKTQGRLRLTTGVLGEIKGSNALIESCKVEPGFSGSPVLDVNGNLVGIVCVQLGGRHAAGMVTTETLMAMFDRMGARPPIPLVGF